MAGLTVDERAITERDRATLRSFGAEGCAWDLTQDGGIEAAIVTWFRALLGDEEAGVSLAHARVAWLSVDGPDRWAERFLTANPPPALVSALHEALPRLTPREVPMAMPEQPLHGDSIFSRANRRVKRAGIRRARGVPAR